MGGWGDLPFTENALELTVDMHRAGSSTVGRNGGRYIIKAKSNRPDKSLPVADVQYQIAQFDPFLGEPRDAVSNGDLYGDGIPGKAVMLMK